MEKKSKQQQEEWYKRKRGFEQEVLAHLKAHGPQPYDGLYVMCYAVRNAEIQTVLYELNLWSLIEIGKDSFRTVSITAASLARLDEDQKPPKLKLKLLP
jgi:hypothetical protein